MKKKLNTKKLNAVPPLAERKDAVLIAQSNCVFFYDLAIPQSGICA
jgi:hypothetical protein